MRCTALVCWSPISGVGPGAASTAASQPAPSSMAAGAISSAGGAAPVGCSPPLIEGRSCSWGCVRPCGLVTEPVVVVAVAAGLFAAGGLELLLTVVEGSCASAKPVEKPSARGKTMSSPAALRLVINPLPVNRRGYPDAIR